MEALRAWLEVEIEIHLGLLAAAPDDHRRQEYLVTLATFRRLLNDVTAIVAKSS